GRRLHRTLDEQSLACAALRGARNFSPKVQQIETLKTSKTLARASFDGLESKLGANTNFCEGGLDPFVNATITFYCREGIPGVGDGPDHRVGPVGIMGNDSASGGTANQRP